MTARINRRVVCRGCKNGGVQGDPKCVGCGQCPNEVQVVQRQLAPGFVVNQKQEVASDERCKNENKDMTFDVERGMDNGAKQSFARASEQRPGQLPGNVVLSLKQQPHATFTRKGNDLFTLITVSLKEALLGFSHSITHLDGHTVEARPNDNHITEPNEVLVSMQTEMLSAQKPAFLRRVRKRREHTTRERTTPLTPPTLPELHLCTRCTSTPPLQPPTSTSSTRVRARSRF